MSRPAVTPPAASQTARAGVVAEVTPPGSSYPPDVLAVVAGLPPMTDSVKAYVSRVLAGAVQERRAAS